ncbi:MAG: MFS transporter [Desulfomonile tiedjei]|nr:MFS transporter [Desulfomonile tiedjei]
MNSAERKILIVTNFGHFLTHYNMLVFPALVLPLTGILNLNMAQVLELSFWQYLLFGLTALPWGVAADRIGGRSLMMLMFVGAGISGLGAAYWIESPWMLSLSLAGVGLFSGIYHPIGMGLISKGVQNLSLAMGYNAMFGGLGLVAAPLATGLLNWIWGPNAAFLALAAMNLLGIGMMMLCPMVEAQGHETKADQGNGMIGAFLILLVAMMLGGVAYTGSSVIITAFLELKSPKVVEAVSSIFGQGDWRNLLATLTTSFVFTVGAMGQYVGGRLGHRFDPRFSYLAFHVVCLPAALLVAASQNAALVAFSAVYFFCLLGSQPPENTLVARLTPRRLHHSAYGLKFILTFGVGSLAVKMMARIDSLWGISATFVALGLVSVGLVSSILVLIWWTNHSAVVVVEGERQPT